MELVLDQTSRLQEGIERIANYMGDLAGWGILACALLVTFDVISRRFFGFSSQGTVEISGYLLAFGISWGLAFALSSRAHIRVDVLVMRLPVKIRAFAHFLALTLLSIFALFLAVRSWNVVSESWAFGARETSALYIPLILPQAPWAFGITVFAFLTLVMLLRTLLLLIMGRYQVVDRMLASRSVEEETEEALEAVGAGSVQGSSTQDGEPSDTDEREES